MKKLDYTEPLEPCLLSKQYFNTYVPVSKIYPFYDIVCYQNKLDINKAKSRAKAEILIELSINFN
jgi:hypothetical protein